MQSLQSTKEAVAIDTPKGLEEFSLYVEEIHDDLLEIKATTATSMNSTTSELAKGLRAYAVCKEVIERCLAKRSVSTLEVEQLQTLYNEMLAAYDFFVESQKGSTVPNQRFTGRLAVGDEALEFKPVKISVKQKEEPKFAEDSVKREIHSQLHPHTLRRKTEQKLESKLTKPIESIIAHYQVNDVIIQWFGSIPAFEKFLEEEIAKVEKPSKLHAFLKVKHASAFFELLIDMPVPEVEQFDKQPREQIKMYLEEKNIEYETYVLWVRHLSKMKRMVPDSNSRTFGELYIIAELVLIEETTDA